MATKVNQQKLAEVSKLTAGDRVKLTNGDIAEFVRLKRTRFIGTINGTGYDIPVNMFAEILEKADNNIDEKLKELTGGDYIYYQDSKGRAILLEFVKFKGHKIIGRNPISKGKVSIEKSMYIDKVAI